MSNGKQIIIIGLGNMGTAIGAHLVEKGYVVHGHDIDSERLAAAARHGVLTHEKLEDAITAQMGVKIVWLMIPAQAIEEMVSRVRTQLREGDLIIDASNTFFHESIHRYHDLAADNIDFIDCGISGGSKDIRFGAAFMVGGEKEAVEKHQELFTDLAVPEGFGHVGSAGAGHFVKMVHNAIEYGMMGAIAEGINVLDEHKEGLDLNLHEALKPYQHGSIIESTLMDWIAEAYEKEGHLEEVAGSVPKEDTEMDMEYLIEHEHVRVLDAAVLQRKLTRLEPSFTGTLISAMKRQFGVDTIIETQSKDEHDTDTHES